MHIRQRAQVRRYLRKRFREKIEEDRTDWYDQAMGFASESTDCPHFIQDQAPSAHLYSFTSPTPTPVPSHITSSCLSSLSPPFYLLSSLVPIAASCIICLSGLCPYMFLSMASFLSYPSLHKKKVVVQIHLKQQKFSFHTRLQD